MRTQIGTEQTEKLAHSFSGRFRPTRARAIGLTPLAFTLLLWGVFFVCPAARAQTNKSLVKAADNPTVYWLQNGKYYPVFASTLDTMQSNGMPGWSWSSIMTLPSIILPRGPAQDFISTGSSSNGLLLKLRTDSAVFLIKDGKREFLSYEVFTQRGYSFSDVIDVPSAIMNMFPELPRADFSFGTGTTSYAVTQGQTAEIVVTIQAINGFSSPITLYANDLPPGYNPVGTAWSPGTLTPVPVGPSFSTLRVATSSSTQVGTFPVTLRAVGGGLEKRIVIYLTVNSAASPTFSVEAFPTSATINQGERGVFVLTVRSVNGFNSQVHVAAIDLPAGYVPAGTQWTQEDVTPPANGSVAPTLTIVTDTATRTGTFPITLRATSGNITKETRVSLTINQYNPCGTSDEIRQSILRLTQFLGNNPVPEYLPGSSLLNYVHSFRLQSYDELYYTSVKLRGLANDSLTYASRTLSQGNLAAACKHYQRAERYKRLMIETETGAVDVWYTRVNNVSDIVRSVYDGSKAAVVFGLGVVPGVGPHAATVVDIAIVPLDYIVDKSMYGEEEAVRRRNENILNALISTVINELPLPQLKGKSIGRYIQDGVSHEVGASRIYSLLEAARHDPKFHQELVRQLSLVIGDLGTTAIERIASELEQAFVDGLQTTHAPSTVQAEELLAVVAASSAPAVVGTQPSNDAAFVSVNLSTITIDFSENVQAGSQSFTLKDSRGVSVPISSVSVSGGSMTVHLASNLARGTTYQASLQAGAVRNLSGIGNGQYAWSFTTSPPPISVGSAVVVSNTGGVGLRLRSTPAFLANGSNVITVLPEGTKLSVIGGPAQADGYTWWNVTGNSLTGWSATGDWLVPNDLAGLRVGAQVSVSNTSGVGLRLRKGPGLSEGIISTMPEGAQMTIISGPYYKDGYLWWNIRGGAGTGFSAVAYWLFPDAPATPTQTLTVASINPGSGVSVSVSPADNRGNYGGATQFTRTYDRNTVVTLSAPAAAGGNSFQKWQRGGLDYSTSPSVNVTMNANHTLTAVYKSPLIQVTVKTNPSGLSFSVDGTTFTSAQTFNWTPGSSHIIGTTSPQTAGTGTQYVWSTWSDGGAKSHNIAPQANATYTANFMVSSSAPSVTTLAPASVAGTAATLRGTVNPRGLATNAWFEWGTSPSLSTFTKTAAQSVGSGSTVVSVSKAVSGLTPNTTYYFRAAASNGGGTSRGSILSFRATALPVLRVNSITVTEANAGVNTPALFTVSLSAASSQTVTVKYATVNGSAVAPADYTALPLATLTFLPGQTARTINAPARGDALDETNETFKLLLSSPTNATVGVGQGTCTILDNDPGPNITIDNATVTEPDAGVGYVTFTVRLSAPSGRPISVKYQTANGTAAAGPDYTAVPLTTLTFQPGQVVRTFRVAVVGDTGKESNETFFVNLSGATNAIIADAQATGVILNDD